MLTRMVLFCVTVSPFAFAEDWHRFLGPNVNGISNESGLIDQWDEDGPEIKWWLDLGTGYGAPSVLDGWLVVHHRVGDQEIILCLDAETGEERWRYAYPSNYVDYYGYSNGPRASPFLTAERVYTFGAEGKLTCVSMKNGELIWQRDVWKEWDVPPAFFGVGASPVIEEGMLYVMTGGQPNAGIAALDPVTGEAIWQSVGKDNWQGQPMTGWRGSRKVDWNEDWKIASYSTPILKPVHGKKTLFALMRQGLVSLDPKTGDVNFSRWFRAEPNESVNAMTPVVIENQVFIANAYYRTGSVMIRIDESGKAFHEVWRNELLELHWNTPIYHNGYLYGVSGRNTMDAVLRCVDFQTGELQWQADGVNEGDDAGRRPRSQAELDQRFGRGSMILADEKLIFLTEQGTLILVKPNPERYEEVCRYPIPGLSYPCWAAPVLSNGLVYLRHDERLVCVSLRR